MEYNSKEETVLYTEEEVGEIESNGCGIGFFLGFCVGLIVFVCCLKFDTKPTAMDVYKGKTELRITSVNGVPTDTTIVFKK